MHVLRDPKGNFNSERPESSAIVVSNDNGEDDSVMLGILAVPSWMTPSDFLEFVAPAVEGMSHLRLIRDSVPNRSMVIIRFLNPADAAEFVEAYNGKPFSSTEPEICNVVHVLSVTFDAEDAFSQNRARLCSPGSMYELPTCPVCLERMDSAITGLITVPCSHTFHCTCLRKWGDSRCPVCRYSQTLLSSHPPLSSSSRTSIPFANPPPSDLSTCVSCSSTTNLWICLICGNIGCGRYGRAHAHEHYRQTTHLYALELETQRVWDYAGDAYVHRLIQNRADGKLVELPSAAASMGIAPRDTGLGPSQADALTAEKIEAIGIEYSYLLTSQLDSQRAFYEEQSSDLQNQIVELRRLTENMNLEHEKEARHMRDEFSRKQKKEGEKLSRILKEKQKSDIQVEKAVDMARKLEKELEEERAVSKGLMTNIAKMKDKAVHDDTERDQYLQKIQDLEDQVRDIMFFLEAKTKIEQGEGPVAELAGGSIMLPSKQTAKKKGRER